VHLLVARGGPVQTKERCEESSIGGKRRRLCREKMILFPERPDPAGQEEEELSQICEGRCKKREESNWAVLGKKNSSPMNERGK